MLADIELQFVSDELDPIKHLRAIVSGGHISGMMVYPDYFVVLGGRIARLIYVSLCKSSLLRCRHLESSREALFSPPKLRDDSNYD